METAHHQILVNALFRTMHPSFARKIGKLTDSKFGGFVSELTFQDFEVLAEQLRGAKSLDINPPNQPEI